MEIEGDIFMFLKRCFYDILYYYCGGNMMGLWGNNDGVRGLGLGFFYFHLQKTINDARICLPLLL
jgi:hypothetical protein